MQLEIFTLCDAATEHAGKLNIIGTFDALRALEAPIAHPQCAIAGRLRFEQIEEGNHRVSLTFADEDGNIVMPKFDSTLAVHFAPGLRTVTSHFVMVIQQIRLPKFGEYTIDLAVDGRQLGSIPALRFEGRTGWRRVAIAGHWQNYRLSGRVESTI